ncbi:MAG: endonuclease/exonuclease/phosphatase family protein [Candidatus Limnocylindrales bacterium]|nr:endonuclease/exonuclease/phosphatase family protein [Candidatus Limnocylindrales bacterium]
MDRLHVATLNIRNLADRWPERLPLLLADMAGLQPDVLALQEVIFPMHQDRLIGAAGEGRYTVARGWAGRPEYGNSLLIREPLAAGDVDRIDLGLDRSAQRAIVRLAGGDAVLVVATHLHHVVDGAMERDEQTRQLLEWLEGAPSAAVHVVMGDFNANPREPAAERMRARGYRSAYAEANGTDPAVTWPSGIQAPGMDKDGDPACLDYIWVRGDVRVASARLEFDRPHPDDPTLYPSDHFGLSAQLELGTPDRPGDR